MCATFALLVLTAAIDGPPPPQPHAIGNAGAVAAASMGQDHTTSVVVACPMHGYSHGYAAHHGGIHGRGYRAGAHLGGKFGYCYYSALVPRYGPTRYNYRWQFDYPWHR